MKNPENHRGIFPRAFTLIELLTVIAIMSVLAALIFPVTGAMKKKAIKVRAQSELAQVETAIERYKTKLGFYPPDAINPGNEVIHQLYYELLGTTNWDDGPIKWYKTLDGGPKINAIALTAAFGSKVAGLMNSSSRGAGDDSPGAVNFLTGLKPTQIGELPSGVKLLVCSVPWPDNLPQPTTNPTLNPWRYDSSSSNRHNLDTYDLWVDIFLGGRTYRISNWSRQPQIF